MIPSKTHLLSITGCDVYVNTIEDHKLHQKSGDVQTDYHQISKLMFLLWPFPSHSFNSIIPRKITLLSIAGFEDYDGPIEDSKFHQKVLSLLSMAGFEVYVNTIEDHKLHQKVERSNKGF